MSSKNGSSAGDGTAETTGTQSVAVGYRTRWGTMYHCSIEAFLASRSAGHYAGKVQLIFTSPPFPLNRAKAYGNKQAGEFSRWLASFATQFVEMLTPSGSIVMEMGNAWERDLLPLNCIPASDDQFLSPYSCWRAHEVPPPSRRVLA